MADLSPVAGAKIYIGGTHSSQATDFAVSDLSGDSWVEIDGWKQCGGYGDTTALITSQLINRNRDLKQKGTANAGQMQNVFSYVQGDAGQAALQAAAAASNKSNYAFKIVYDDSLGTNGTTDYFIGLVMNCNRAGGTANTIRDYNATIEINSNLATTPAA